MEQNNYDILVIGAGAAGLMAALELAMAGRKTAILEARDRIGGRIYTVDDPRFTMPVELGAEFVHGKLELTNMLLQKAGIKQTGVSGDVWRHENGGFSQSDFIEDYSVLQKKFKELKEDMPVSVFLERHLQGDEYEELRDSLEKYVAGYYAAEPSRASTFALRDELQQGNDEQFRVEGGYGKLLQYFSRELEEKQCTVFLSSPVSEIRWQRGRVEAVCGSRIFQASKTIITVPLGVLQEEKIGFSPALPVQMAAFKKLGYGPAIKIILQFKMPFWKQKEFTGEKKLASVGFLFSDEPVPTWWTQHPSNAAVLTGWLGGPYADRLKHTSTEELLHLSLASLATIFGLEKSGVERLLTASRISDWLLDPYACGAYSYETVGGSQTREELRQPIENTLYFAGEGLHSGTEIGTVEAALLNGRETAVRVNGQWSMVNGE
jgi:monoamine oxidase